jgi:DNA-directed RNA polymerase specialized sigma24 family protein
VLRAFVEQARHGDEEAFGALVRVVGDRCIFIAHRILRDADVAQDAVQLALVQAWTELPTLRDLDRFEAWLHRIPVNVCHAEARRRRHEGPTLRPGASLTPAAIQCPKTCGSA